MRDPKRIQEFCSNIAKIWEQECPDWRFAQLVMNVFGYIGKDPWYMEENEMMEVFERYFHMGKERDEHGTCKYQ